MTNPDQARADADYKEALLMNTEHDQRQRDLAAAVNATAVADALIAESVNAVDFLDCFDCPTRKEPTDEEIIEVYLDAFGGTREQAMVRLHRFDASLVA